MATNKNAAAHHLIRKAASRNSKLTNNYDDQFQELQINFRKQEQTQSKGNITDLFKYPGIRRNTFILTFTWFATGFIYYGLSLNIGDLGGNLVLNFAIAGALEFPAFAVSIYGLKHYGRRTVQAWIMFGAAIGSFAAIPFYLVDFGPYIPIALGMTVKFALSCSWSVIYIYSAEGKMLTCNWSKI